MRIGFLSDTHGGYQDTVKALGFLEGCERIFHLGDVLYHGPRNDLPATYEPAKLADYLHDRDDITYVHGNCDADVDEMVIGQDLSRMQRIVDLGGERLLLDHGYTFSMDELVEQAKAEKAGIIVTGHTHIKTDGWQDGIRLLNPGSTTIPKDGSKSCYVLENGKLEVFTWV